MNQANKAWLLEMSIRKYEFMTEGKLFIKESSLLKKIIPKGMCVQRGHFIYKLPAGQYLNRLIESVSDVLSVDFLHSREVVVVQSHIKQQAQAKPVLIKHKLNFFNQSKYVCITLL